MTVYTLQAPMARLNIVGGMFLRLEAVDPTTGAMVTGVTGSRWAIYGRDLSGNVADGGDLSTGPFMLVPGPVPVGNPGDGAEASRTGGQ